jgi:hypothetical protein
MSLKIPSMSRVLGLLILMSGTQVDARGQAVGEPAPPPRILHERSAKGTSAEARREIAESAHCAEGRNHGAPIRCRLSGPHNRACCLAAGREPAVTP